MFKSIHMELFGITITEYIGYLASFMVLLSFTMKDVKKLRMVNMAGCILFVVYGFLMQNWADINKVLDSLQVMWWLA